MLKFVGPLLNVNVADLARITSSEEGKAHK